MIKSLGNEDNIRPFEERQIHLTRIIAAMKIIKKKKKPWRITTI